MGKNVGTIDKAVRILLGIAMIAWAIMGGHEYSWIGWIGAVPIATAFLSWCPLYTLFGIKTCPAESTEG